MLNWKFPPTPPLPSPPSRAAPPAAPDRWTVRTVRHISDEPDATAAIPCMAATA
jgi:hypothetical protein